MDRAFEDQTTRVPRALFVEGNLTTLAALANLARSEGYEVERVQSVAEARVALAARPPEILVIDLGCTEDSDLTVLDELGPSFDSAVVLVTNRPRVDTAVEALRRGVTDYLPIPVDVDRLRSILANVARPREAAVDETSQHLSPDASCHFGGLVGVSKPIRRIFELIARVAPTSATVVVTGETGTGKDVVARTIHDCSRRASGPFEAVNCGAISPSLMESELFGHERGSFTGADRRHHGCFERANRGTLFLDEITEMPAHLQVKLLRILERGDYTRVGGETPVRMDARVLAATNRDIREATSSGRLREDLYYRLKVFQIYLPPLRDRINDIEPLATYFLDKLGPVEGISKTLDPDTLGVLRKYSWPGNVRELRNVVHSASIMTTGNVITPRSLPKEISYAEPAREFDGSRLSLSVGQSLRTVERRLIVATLAHFHGNKVKTAEVLGISLKTLYNRLHQYQQPGQDQSAVVATASVPLA
jgi:DNA-binding NtrC family response regulator